MGDEMKKIVEILKNNPAVKTILKGKGQIVTNEASDEAYLIASAFLLQPRTMIIVKESQYQAMQLYTSLQNMINDVVYFPSDESLRVEAVAYSYELLGERVNALNALCENKPVIVVAHTHSVIRYVSSPEVFKENKLALHVGQVIEPSMLRKQLISMGYQVTQRVDTPFYMSKRGGVIDVYSIQYESPIRIEFFDDEIDTISFYDKDTQRRSDNVKEVEILPATDMLYRNEEVDQVVEAIKALKAKSSLEGEQKEELDENIEMDIQSLYAREFSPRSYQHLSLFSSTGSLLDYAPDCLLITASYEGINNQYKRFAEESFYYFHELEEIGEMVKGLKLYHDVVALLKKHQIDLINFKSKENQVLFNARPVQISLVNSKTFISQLKDYLTYDKVLLALSEKHQVDSMVNMFDELGMKYTLVSVDDQIYEGINICLANLPEGMEFVDERVAVLTSNELFKSATHKKRYIKYKNATIIKDYNELNIGDYVVHDVNGIGQYMGIKTLEVGGVHKDYLYIAYKGNDVLYVPVENFQLIRKYSSKDGKVPRINELNSTKWQKEKARVRQKVDGLADDLIALYAERMKQPGFAFEPDSAMQLEFEEQFGYSLTPDQQRSVDEIKADMEKPRPMDRLLCGDVGFGKTEVALRACMKAILSGKQCAFLCPTTILSQQHYHTMSKRFENFPVEIRLLNRFTTTKEKKAILKELKEGKVDLIVGTHRLLSKDVVYKDLGLLCIDEEQRFGVRQKEKIKEYRKTIDVLTLTATPIPRTLQMSLMGVRGLSQIETPPMNRLPVQTYVAEMNPPLVRQVIERELARGGQVFYLHNRTENIMETAAMIQNMLPNARIGIGHGQMKKEELEDVMNDFVEHHYDILVCTTIIETGIDIPNANTIIVEDADRFGLAQLYQIKGRVGRSERLAYAYLLYRKNRQLNEEATKRLKAIKDFTQLGSGYKIAMRDLSIRGAGDILGGEQAGFIDTVGFDMYMKILQDAIKEKQGKKDEESDVVPVKNIKVNGYIPEDYVESDMEKLELYQRVYHANKMTELNAVEKELVDLYGKLPHEVENIVVKRRFEILCHNKNIDEVKEDPKGLTMRFTQEFSEHTDGEKLFEIANKLFTKPQFKYADKEISLYVKSAPDYINQATSFLQTVLTMHA